jgi:hypothetical protein
VSERNISERVLQLAERGLHALAQEPPRLGEVVGDGGDRQRVLAREVFVAGPRRVTLIGVGVAAVSTLPIAHLNAQHYGRADYCWKIMLPGALVGAIVGYVVMRYGKAPVRAASSVRG